MRAWMDARYFRSTRRSHVASAPQRELETAPRASGVRCQSRDPQRGDQIYIRTDSDVASGGYGVWYGRGPWE